MSENIKVQVLDRAYTDRNGKLFAGPDLPVYTKPGDAGMDVRAYIEEPKIMSPGEIWLCPTGLHFAIPLGFECQVRPRSGTCLKHGVTVLNSPGTVDSGYRGEVGVILINMSKKSFRIEPNDRIAQFVFTKYSTAEFETVDILPESERATTGFGESGVK
jgi:dUTP pyrophosphatase